MHNRRMPTKPKNTDLVNERITFPEVLLIDEDGEQLGIKSRVEAMSIAQNKNLDLLCVAPNAKPPVCKILNYGKYRFEQQKKAKEIKKNQKIVELKEVQLSSNIGKHDFDTKLRAAIRFLEKGDKVKITIRFRGRQMAFVNKGVEVVERFIDALSEISTVEKKPTLDGRILMGIIVPISAKK